MSSSSWNLKFSIIKKMERYCSIETQFSIKSKRPFAFRPKFCLLITEAGLETRIFGNGTVSFGYRTDRPVTTSGVVDHFDRRISTRIKAFHLFLDRNFRIFRVMEGPKNLRNSRTRKPPIKIR